MDSKKLHYVDTNYINRELRLFWLFTKRDLIVSVLSASIFMLIAWQANGDGTLEHFLLGIIYFALYIYPFNILNQIHGIEEDKINKPDRPLPQNLLSIKEAYYRYLILTGLYLLLGLYLGVFLWTVLWVVVTHFLNAGGWDKQWVTKNVFAMGLGTLSQLCAAWSIMGEMSPHTMAWIVTISVWVGLTSSTQDFRDQEGDSIADRITLPLLFGDTTARKIMSGIWACSAMGVVLIALMLNQYSISFILIILLILISLWHLTIISNLLTKRSPEHDRATYKSQCFLYCFLLVSTCLII